MAETTVLHRIMLAVSRLGTRVFRNNVGLAKHTDRRGETQYVRYGLCDGSSDLIGWQSVMVTPAMVGRRVAVFVAIEVKTEDRRSKATTEQGDFLSAVQAAGGIAGVARTEGQAEGVITLGIRNLGG